MPGKKANGATRVRLRPADSFDLVRLIARSQSDPRKALAELVQNSLDAGAQHVRITWFTHQGRRAVSVADDGGGVFPSMERRDALQRIATSLGASHKAQLTAAERHRQMTLGKYGIGLLGFWSVGKWMEIRTRVAGSEVWSLRLREEGRDGEVGRARVSRLALEGETLTEVLITEIHEAAEPQIKPRRLAAYLAGELRGQLRDRDVALEIVDRVARGLSAKRLVVRPQRFRGVPVEALTELAVPGFATARVELHLLPEGDPQPGRVSLACGGTTVLDDVAEFDGVIDRREPWSLGRFEGVIDFPDLEVPPGTRRGIVPNEAARAFRAALPSLEVRVREALDADAARRATEREADVAREIRRMFRRLPQSLPHYDFFDVKDGGRAAARAAAAGGVAEEPADAEGVEAAEEELPPEPPMLYAPGPLASVEIRPRRSAIPAESSRRLRAVALDADGRAAAGAVEFVWSLAGPGRLDARGDRAGYVAPEEPGEAVARVVATQYGVRAEAECRIVVTDVSDAPERGGAGVPDPEPVSAPGELWRSRIDAGRWQYNTAHPDYELVRGDERRRVRYLAHLFAKEIVLRNFADAPAADLLERMVQVLAHAGDPQRRAATRDGTARDGS